MNKKDLIINIREDVSFFLSIVHYAVWLTRNNNGKFTGNTGLRRYDDKYTFYPEELINYEIRIERLYKKLCKDVFLIEKEDMATLKTLMNDYINWIIDRDGYVSQGRINFNDRIQSMTSISSGFASHFKGVQGEILILTIIFCIIFLLI